MDLKQIEKLMVAMGRNNIKRFVIKREGLELELEKDSENGSGTGQERVFYDSRWIGDFPQGRPIPVDTSVPSRESSKGESAGASQVAEPAAQGDFISSPLVGTFYSAPSPDSQPFIRPGDMVSEDTIVCIVEAMKVMNEVKAGIAGKVEEVLLTDGDPVQFGSKLFRVVKAD